MCDHSQPISVRTSAAYFLGAIAQHNTLLSSETYIVKILPKVK
jgi:hypothetical protein